MKLEMHKGWCLVTDDLGKPITGKTWWETYALAKEWSVRSGKKLKLMPARTAERLCCKDKAFKKMMVKYWMWNAEIMKACKTHEELKKKLKLKTKYVWQWGNDNGISSVWSTWHSDEGCCYAYAGRPSDGTGNGVLAFLVV